MLDTFRKTFDLVGRDKPGRWVALIAGAAVVSLLEMLGAVLIYLLLALLADPGGRLAVPIVGDIRGFIGVTDERGFLLAAAVVLGVFFLFRASVHVGYTYVKHRLAHNAGARLSAKLAQGYLLLPYAHHLRRSSSELIRNANTNVEELVLQCFLATIIVIAEGFVVIGLLIVMLTVAPGATGLAVLIIGSAALLLLKLVQPRLKRLGTRAQAMRQRTLSSLQQSLQGIRDIKVLSIERRFADTYRTDRDQLARSLFLRGTVIEMPRLVIETSLVAFILILFASSVIAGSATEEVLSTLGLFAYAGLRIQPSLQKLISGLNNVRYSAAAVQDVHADLVLVEEVKPPSDSVEPFGFREELRFQQVSFTYGGTERPVLEDVNLKVEPGELIGICGPTGGGKTTLADLVIGVLDPTDGRVTVDGVDLARNRAGWFRKLGVVPQMVFLVDDTVRRNIALGVPDDELDEAALDEAIELAQLREFVGELPDGLDTVIGERGLRVSGGQRQRIAIARALYRRPDVLVFDEGTSALDNTTESVLITSLEHLRGDHTIFMVAHRLSTVRNCDRIIYLEEGRVSAVGNYRELQRVSPGFRRLAETV